MIKKLFFRISFCLSLVLLNSLFAQSATAGLYSGGAHRSAEEGFAAEEFRRGVQAYYRGSFNDSVLLFEKALNYLPQDSLILEWLGNAYYQAGMEETAIQHWTRAASSGYGGLLLQNKIEVVKERRVSASFSLNDDRYTEAGSFSGVYNGNLIFSGPVSVLPENDGTSWILAYGSNEIVQMNMNGLVISRITGPLNGFDRPVDIIRLADGTLLVSESAGDRLAQFSKKGKFITYFGKKGRGIGELLGPQYMAQDARHNIYVSDYGNRRIDVFDKDGNGLFYFGQADSSFTGLKGPTGVAVIENSVFVADDVYGAIYEFDLAGNFVRILVPEKTFLHPESMKVWGQYLVVCDTDRVVSVDSSSGSLYENARTGKGKVRLTSAVPDVNGNVIVTDITSNEVYVMTRMQELVGGLFVHIERINASKFPEVVLDVRVENRHRNPIVGLKENNFYFTEEKRPVSKLKFQGASSQNTVEDITILVDRNISSKNYTEQIDSVVREIASSMKNRGTLRIVSAGKVPALEYSGRPSGALQFSCKALKTEYSESVPLDLAFRLCANDLVNAEKKRAVVLISDGTVTNGSFDRYNLYETTSYLNNNHIDVAFVNLTQNTVDESLTYIVEHTPGKFYYVFQPEGLSSLIEDLLENPSGLYTFSYTSVLSTRYGEKYLPVEVEAYLLNRSGRDETGYFSPLE